jgi:hypothetical protein
MIVVVKTLFTSMMTKVLGVLEIFLLNILFCVAVSIYAVRSLSE